MDLDKALVAAILAGGRAALLQAMRAGLRADFLMGEGRIAFEFVWGYFRDYGQVPNHGILLAKFGIMLEPAPGNVDFFVKEVLKRRVALRLEDTVAGVGEHLQRRDVDAAYQQIREQLRAIEQEAITGPRVGNLLARGQEVLDYYNMIKSGARGVQTPWPTINAATLGFWPEDLVLFAARPGIGKCVAAGTRIPDPDTGTWNKVEDVVARQLNVFSFDKADGVVSRTPAAWVYTGTKECLELQTRLGDRISVTPEHPMLTSRGWVRADELTLQDSVVSVARLPEPLHPIDMTDAEVSVLAILLSEGSISGHHVGFSTADSQYVAFTENAARDLGSNVTRRRKYDYDFVPSTPMRSLLSKVGLSKEKAIHKFVPDAVFSLPNEKLSLFLRVFWWGDGGKDATIGLASETLLDGVKRLLLRFGVVTRKRFKLSKCNGKAFPSWELRVESWTIPEFKKLMKGMPGAKGRAIQKLRDPTNPNFDNVPLTPEMEIAFRVVADHYRVRTGGLGRNKGRGARRGLFADVGRLLGRKDRQTSLRSLTGTHGKNSISRRSLGALIKTAAPALDQFKWMVEKTVVFSPLKSIKRVGERPVYDLSISGTHCFIAEGFVAHNTWLALMLLLKAWEDFEQTNERALFVTTEMSQMRIAMRFYSLKLKLSYKDIRQGNLGTENERSFFEGVQALMKDERLKIIGGDFDFRLESFEAAIEEAQPKIVYLDGAYLLRATGNSKNEQATNVFDELKRVAKRKQIPVVVTTQFNRKVDANDAGSVKSVDKLAQSDAAGWNADICYAIIQTDEMKRAKELILRPLKFREGEAEDLKIRWDIANMDFSEMQDGPVPGPTAAPDPGGGPVVPF